MSFIDVCPNCAQMTGPTQRNPVSGTLDIFAVNSGIQQFFAVKSENLGFGIRNTAQGIRIPLMIGIRNPRLSWINFNWAKWLPNRLNKTVGPQSRWLAVWVHLKQISWMYSESDVMFVALLWFLGTVECDPGNNNSFPVHKSDVWTSLVPYTLGWLQRLNTDRRQSAL